MKRFYKSVETVRSGDGHAIVLDGKAVKTPAKNNLVLPGPALAEAVAAEWAAQGENIDLPAMRLTRLANGALDRVLQRSAVAAEICEYAETDLVCYRAAGPPELAARQADAWDPMIEWANTRYGIALEVTDGILPVPQPEVSLGKVRVAVEAFDDFTLSALHLAVSAIGSVVIGLALADGRIDGAAAWECALVDELWQVGQWGEDDEAVQRRAGLLADLTAAAEFLELCRRPA